MAQLIIGVVFTFVTLNWIGDVSEVRFQHALDHGSCENTNKIDYEW